MANTFSQIYLHFVFAVKHRYNLIPKAHKEELHKYITALVQNRKAKMISIHCMPDHTHLFVGFKPSVLMRKNFFLILLMILRRLLRSRLT